MFARYLLCVLCLGTLISCGADRDIVVEDEISADGSDVPDAVSPDSYSGDIPVVTLVTEGLWDEEGSLQIQFHLEIDRSLEHNLSICFERVHFSVFGHDNSDRGLLGILQGETESLSFTSYALANKTVLTILPASMRKEVVLPYRVYVGRDRDADEKVSFAVPVGHQFKPYKIGDPGEIILRRGDIDGFK